MTNVLIKHRVNDFAAWKNVFDNFVDFRKSSGEKSYRILHAGDDSNDLTILFEWDSKTNAETFLASSELKDAMQKAGVAAWAYINGFMIRGRLAGIAFSHATGWLNHEYDADGTRNLQLAVNVIVYALTQEGSITQRLMQMVN